MKWFCISLFTFYLLIPSSDLGAQFAGIDTSISISAFPAFAQPGQNVTLTLNAASIDTNGATITWLVDGSEQVSARNTRTLNITARDLGQQTNILANIRTGSGLVIPVNYILTPSRVDLFIEADTYASAFYQGRPLPSSGSNVRAIAFPSVPSGATANNLGYRWSINNQVIGGGTEFGRQTVIFTMPSDKESTVSVDVFERDGTLVGQKAVLVPRAEPRINFYENNPLRGLASTALADPFNLIAEEITVRAEPYYMNKTIFEQSPLLEWEIDGTKIDNPSIDPQEITLQKNGVNGSFTINFHLRNLNDLIQGVRDSFTMQF